jgi:branched-chain amino acid transport system substrate-binding protein
MSAPTPRPLVSGLAVLATLAVSAAGLTACGSSGAGPATSAPTGSPIVFTVNAATSGPAPLPFMLAGAKAAAKAINAAGGIKGRPLVIKNCDDQFDPNRASACARTAKADGVIAYTGAETTAGDAYIPVLSTLGIPTIGNIPASQSDFTSKLSYPIGSGALVELAGAGALMTKAGCSKVGVAYADNSAAKFAAETYLAKGLALGGKKIDVEVAVAMTAADMSPYASSVLSKGADCVNVTGPDAVADKMIVALKQAKPDLKIFQPASAFGPATLKKLGSAADGVYMSAGIAPPSTATNIPGVKIFNAEMDASGDKKTDRNEFMINTWATVHIVAQQLEDATAIDSASLIKAMTAAGPIDFSPIVPFNWSAPNNLFPGFRTFATRIYVSKVDNGVAKLLNNGQTVDITDLSAFTL